MWTASVPKVVGKGRVFTERKNSQQMLFAVKISTDAIYMLFATPA